jgi:hypothetical protein
MCYDFDWHPLNPRRLFDPTKDLGREYREATFRFLKLYEKSAKPYIGSNLPISTTTEPYIKASPLSRIIEDLLKY